MEPCTGLKHQDSYQTQREPTIYVKCLGSAVTDSARHSGHALPFSAVDIRHLGRLSNCHVRVSMERHTAEFGVADCLVKVQVVGG